MTRTTKMLPYTFFDRPADVVARKLIGCLLCVRTKEGTITRLLITETEAYMGPHDLASHSSRGRTKRTETMFAGPGTIYVYFIYGMYEMLNIVTGKEDYPAAVLIRGAGEYDGPGKLTKALGIGRHQNGRPLGRRVGIWIEEAPTPVSPRRVRRTARIGVHYAGDWASKKLRFVLKTA